MGHEDALEEETATHSSILDWDIPRTEEPSLAGYSPWGHKELNMTEQLKKSNNINHSSLRDFKAWASAEGKSQKKNNREERWASRREEGKGRTETAQGWWGVEESYQEWPLYEFSYSERESELTSSSNYYQMTEYSIP